MTLFPRALFRWIWISLAAVLVNSGSSAAAAVKVSRISYHGWEVAYRIQNCVAEIVVVPAIGRVMQFGARGEDGVFWENRELDGAMVDASLPSWTAKEWVNLGGDKTWPAPEGQWEIHTGRRGWRPAPAFDGLPFHANARGDSVELTSLVDPYYGIEVWRRISLAADEPIMTITTRFRKILGPTLPVSVWVVTQFKDPLRVYLPLSTPKIFPQGYLKISDSVPLDLKMDRGFVSLSRDHGGPHKIGSAAGSLLWVGEKWMCRVDAPRQTGRSYPDGGSSVEVYTNPEPLSYVELETLGPISTVKIGQTIERINRYTLIPRTQSDPDLDARQALGAR